MNPGQVKTTAILVLFGTVFALGCLYELAGNRTPDFTTIETVAERKQAFFDYFRPLISTQNGKLRSDRLRVQALASIAPDMSWFDQFELYSLAASYDLDTAELNDAEIFDELLLRIDTIPPALVLAQAAKESGWGTARFAIEGNNYFGQRCWDPGCGITPAERAAGRQHEVATYADAEDSLQSYLQNLNTHTEYEQFRVQRARMRADGGSLSGVALAEYLDNYSERREQYIQELQSFIRFNQLEKKH